MKITNRLVKIQDYIFSSLEETKNNLIDKGARIYDLSIGDPDLPTPDFIKDEFINRLSCEGYNKYPPYSGIIEFKRAVANYYRRKFDVELDYRDEVGVLIGSKEGIAHLFLALTDPSDYVLIPNPGYPVYLSCAQICGCMPYCMNLSQQNDYLPNIYSIYPEVARRAKMLIINYPNNPTGAVANYSFLKDVIKFGKRNDIAIINDSAYINIVNDEKYSISILQVDGAKDIAVEVGSLSKTYNMAGWRIGYIVGNREIIKKLMLIKNNFDSGVFIPVQYAAAEALNNGDKYIEYINKIYLERRKLVEYYLSNIGINIYNSNGTFYVWFKIPDGYKSEEFCKFLLSASNVLLTPGDAFGNIGEGYCRISLTKDLKTLEEAMIKMAKSLNDILIQI
ncbi:LL-diaminopimelate aminotransferase [Caloramator mitchellensis]|uniref:Aminotransferase n=1 Tax=Caloramator mitchellensis TaxID=908809 RepID=A0A0R3K1S0_CALMK|nr:aminotransferase class I/II-fold pyridoxal phosphate-dependent enzyme [Caloramator mitchellensis]KRQ86917.1 LL-diaminopimelate aminotransferase [Caloramator mitchellensis]